MRLIIVLIIGALISSCTSNPFDFCQDGPYTITPEKDSQNKIEAFFPATFRIEHEEAPTKALNEKLVGFPNEEDLYPYIEISVMEGVEPNDSFDEIMPNLTFHKYTETFKDPDRPTELVAIFQKTAPDKDYFIQMVFRLEVKEGQNPDQLGLCQFESIVGNTKFVE